MITITAKNQINYLMRFEDEDLTDAETVALFAYLIKSGLVWSLQGFYGRYASALIKQGFISPAGDVLKEVPCD